MAKCIYCGQPAGLFRRQHSKCAQLYQDGQRRIASEAEACLRRIVSEAEAGLSTGADPDQLAEGISKTANENRIPSARVHDALKQVWTGHLQKTLEAGYPTVQQEKTLRAFKWRFGLSVEELEASSGAYTKLGQSGILRETSEGRVPHSYPAQTSPPFAFSSSETVVWLFQNVGHLVFKQQRHYEGGSSGMSVRVAPGVYIRSSAFQGYPVVSTHAIQDDAGQLAVTDENVYFAGQTVAFRIPHRKIAAVIPYANGFRIVREAASSKP